MSATVTIPKARLLDLTICPVAGNRFVVKNRTGGTYFTFGEQEHFLLMQLDGVTSDVKICEAFQNQFGEELSCDDLQEFIKILDGRGLLQGSQAATQHAADVFGDEDDDDDLSAATTVNGKPARKRQSLLYCRFSVFDPDRLFNWLEPKIRWVWTPAFLAVTAIMILAAMLLMANNRHQMIAGFSQAWRWETVILTWLTVVLATTLHEFAHGLTCKRYGGEVHEVGVLFMFFTPCFFCNVSDAWLIPQKSRRMWITLAGGYCDLIIWSLAAFVWRLTVPNSLINYLAWVILSVCGIRVFFNFNPLSKLDGYYLLSDWLEIPNLRRRGWDHWMSIMRWALWGANRPASTPQSKALMAYGAVSWSFSLVFLGVMFVQVIQLLNTLWGFVGFTGTSFIAVIIVKRLFRGFSKGELYMMLTKRHLRTAVWCLGFLAIPGALAVCQIQDRAGGDFQVRPGTRVEIRAAVAGFLKEVHFDEGQHVSQSALIGRLEIPDLASLITQKRAAVQESQANLRRLEIGARPEEVAEQKHRVERASEWRDMAQRDLERARTGLQEELARLDEQIAQRKTEFDFATHSKAQSERLLKKGVLAGEQFRAEVKKFQIAQSQWQQALAAKREREASGVLSHETELGRRQKELADSEAALSLLSAGARPEEIAAERARLARFQEELSYHESLQDKVLLHSPVAGLMVTPRMTEKIGQYFEKGALICVIEEITALEAEIAVGEEEVSGVEIGQIVELKARALPLQTFKARVDRVAPVAIGSAVPGASVDRQSSITVYCRVDNPEGNLRSGMTGYGRVYREHKSLATVILNKFLRYFRTEFWW